MRVLPRSCFGIADAYCEANNLDLSRESNAGRGPVDFKVSKGYSNRQLLHGLTKQIEAYQNAEKSRVAVYLVLDVAGPRGRLTSLKNHIRTQRAAGARLPEVLFVDARSKPSASRA